MKDEAPTLSAQVEDRAENPYPDLNLLLEWPNERPTKYWMGILSGSAVLHLLVFGLAVQLPSFVLPAQREHVVPVRHIRLYLPRDVLTQKTPNRQKLSKNIDLADLLSTPSEQMRRPSPAASVKRFELPKQVIPQRPSKAAPQILPDAPQIANSETPGPVPPGIPDGLTSKAPTAPNESPFQNVGSQAPVNAHPTLKPPSANVQSVISGMAQSGASRKLVISDDRASEPMPGTPGSVGNTGEHHTAVELESDPQGADFKPYLRQILTIVRANWKRVIPESARMGTLHGRTTIEFIINRDGSIPKLVTADSSGSEPLDRAAVAGLSMSNPLPRLPSDYKGFQVRLAFSFSYNMSAQ
jgi:TonB family protein